MKGTSPLFKRYRAKLQTLGHVSLPVFGYTRTGNKRIRMTTKDGNKFYYKGTGSTGIGRATKHGRYIINWDKVRTYKAPKDFSTTQLHGLVSPHVPEPSTIFEKYHSAVDGREYIQMLKDYIEYGDEIPGVEITADYEEIH